MDIPAINSWLIKAPQLEWRSNVKLIMSLLSFIKSKVFRRRKVKLRSWPMSSTVKEMPSWKGGVDI